MLFPVGCKGWARRGKIFGLSWISQFICHIKYQLANRMYFFKHIGNYTFKVLWSFKYVFWRKNELKFNSFQHLYHFYPTTEGYHMVRLSNKLKLNPSKHYLNLIQFKLNTGNKVAFKNHLYLTPKVQTWRKHFDPKETLQQIH